MTKVMETRETTLIAIRELLFLMRLMKKKPLKNLLNLMLLLMLVQRSSLKRKRMLKPILMMKKKD